MTLETQVMNLESAIQNMETVKVMDLAKSTMANIRMDIDTVEEMMEKIKEEMDLGAELSDALAQPIGPALFDEDELMEELVAQMEADRIEEEQLLKSATRKEEEEEEEQVDTSYPPAPMDKLPTILVANATAEEEEELRQLMTGV